MKNISKFPRTIVGCSAAAIAVLVGFMQSAQAAEQYRSQNLQANRSTNLVAQLTNQSNVTGVSVTNAPVSSFSPSNSTSTSTSYSPVTIGQASSLFTRMSVAQSNYSTAVANLNQALSLPPVAAPPVPSVLPIRYSREGVLDASTCNACFNTDTVETTPTATIAAEAIAAKAAVAKAEAELAAARIESQKFLKSVTSENMARTTDTTIW